MSNIWVDSLQLLSARPTLVDRRGFVRTKVLSINQAMTDLVAQQMADVWLRAHSAPPFVGDLTSQGRALRGYLDGRGVHAFAVGEMAGELVHFPNDIDPQTGHVGRDGVIAGVTYDGDSEQAQVSIDSSREDFDALVERYGIASGSSGSSPGAGAGTGSGGGD